MTEPTTGPPAGDKPAGDSVAEQEMTFPACSGLTRPLHLTRLPSEVLQERFYRLAEGCPRRRQPT
jgi:hypothetical protein